MHPLGFIIYKQCLASSFQENLSFKANSSHLSDRHMKLHEDLVFKNHFRVLTGTSPRPAAPKSQLYRQGLLTLMS